VPVTLVWPDCDRLVRRPATLPDRIRNVVLEDEGHIPMGDAPGPLARSPLEGSAQPPGERAP
jgi:hypothetical protein